MNKVQLLIGTTFQGGVAYLLWTHKHPILAYLFGAGAAYTAILAFGGATPTLLAADYTSIRNPLGPSLRIVSDNTNDPDVQATLGALRAPPP